MSQMAFFCSFELRFFSLKLMGEKCPISSHSVQSNTVLCYHMHEFERHHRASQAIFFSVKLRLFSYPSV